MADIQPIHPVEILLKSWGQVLHYNIIDIKNNICMQDY